MPLQKLLCCGILRNHYAVVFSRDLFAPCSLPPPPATGDGHLMSFYKGKTSTASRAKAPDERLNLLQNRTQSGKECAGFSAVGSREKGRSLRLTRCSHCSARWMAPKSPKPPCPVQRKMQQTPRLALAHCHIPPPLEVLLKASHQAGIKSLSLPLSAPHLAPA